MNQTKLTNEQIEHLQKMQLKQLREELLKADARHAVRKALYERIFENKRQ